MHKTPTTPLLVHFEENERTKLIDGQADIRERLGKKKSETLIVRKAVNMVLDDPKLRRRLIRAFRSELEVIV